jgi:arylsulfatase A-like enzyme
MRPGILWILTTQWRAQACGFSGDANARTPSLDALAGAGAVFGQAVTPHPFGPFARAALLTGIPSPENGLRDYYDPLPARTRTIAHRLAERGYETLFFGKWHLGSRDRRPDLVGEAHARIQIPQQERGGFGFWEGFESGFLLNHPWLHGTRLPEPVRFEGYQSDVLCERALEVLRGREGSWFAVVSLEAPHPPYDAPAAGLAPRGAGALDLRPNVPRGGEVEARARRELAGYYAHIEATDRSIGRLVGGLPSETCVVVTSVHGDMHGSHGLFRKGWPHEESVRVPLLVRAPGLAGPVDWPASLIGLAALTEALADGAGGGQALRALGDGAASRISMPSVVALRDQCDRAWSGLRTPTRKLVRDGAGDPWLYFDLARDPFESRNLAVDPEFAREIEGFG